MYTRTFAPHHTLQEDSVYLWKAVCANALLAKVELILFMNKCDILDAKLRSGIRLAKYIVSYGNRPNDYENTSACASLFYCVQFAVMR